MNSDIFGGLACSGASRLFDGVAGAPISICTVATCSAVGASSGGNGSSCIGWLGSTSMTTLFSPSRFTTSMHLPPPVIGEGGAARELSASICCVGDTSGLVAATARGSARPALQSMLSVNSSQVFSASDWMRRSSLRSLRSHTLAGEWDLDRGTGLVLPGVHPPSATSARSCKFLCTDTRQAVSAQGAEIAEQRSEMMLASQGPPSPWTGSRLWRAASATENAYGRLGALVVFFVAHAS